MSNNPRNINPDAKMWSVAAEWSGAYFQMRHFSRIFGFDSSGLWSYPALVQHGGDICWLHLMFPVEPMKNKSRLLLYPPQCLVISPCNGIMIIEFQDLRFRTDLPWKDAANPVGRYPWRGIKDMSLREFNFAESDVMLLYDNARKEFDKSKTLPKEFVNAYKRITNPVCIRYLNYFAADFSLALASQETP